MCIALKRLYVHESIYDELCEEVAALAREANMADGFAEGAEFGPVLPILRYSSEEEVIARANNSAFGLGGSVWSADEERARLLGLQLECGTVWINQHCAFGPNIPFPPAKESGLGVEWAMKVLRSSPPCRSLM